MSKPNITRLDLVDMLGQPDDISRGTRKYPIPTIYVYGHTEYHFTDHLGGILWMVFDGYAHRIQWRLDQQYQERQINENHSYNY